MWSELQALLLALPQTILNFSLLLLVLALVFVSAERRFPLHPQKALRKNWFTDVVYFYLGLIVPAYVLLLVTHLAVALLQLLGPLPWHAWVAGLAAPVAFVASTVAAEIAYYWAHRLTHQVPFLWRFHAVHHSAPQMDWLVASSTHPLDLSFFRSFVFVCLLVLGFGRNAPGGQDMAATFYVLWMTIWSYFIHANIRVRLGWLEYVVATPGFHHWHHVKGDRSLLDKNFSANLPWVDLLFGTFYLPRNAWPAQYGIEEQLSPHLWGQLLGPLRRRRSRPAADQLVPPPRVKRRTQR